MRPSLVTEAHLRHDAILSFVFHGSCSHDQATLSLSTGPGKHIEYQYEARSQWRGALLERTSHEFRGVGVVKLLGGTWQP